MIGCGPARRPRPASSSASPARSRATNASTVCGGGEVLAQRLADQHGDGQRVARGVAQQRPPVALREQGGRGGRRARRRAAAARASASAAAAAGRAGRPARPARRGGRSAAPCTGSAGPGHAGSSARSSCSAWVQALGVPGGNPVTGSTLSHTHSTGTCARTCSTRSRRCARVGDRLPVDAVGLQQPGELVPGRADEPVQRQVVLEGGPQHRPRPPLGVVQAAGGLVPAGELRRRGGLPRPGERVQQHHRLGVERPVQGQQRLVPAEEPRIRRPRQPRPPRCRIGPRRPGCRGEPGSAARRGARVQQDERGGLVDDRDGPVLQRDRGRADLPGRVGGQRPPGRSRRLAERPARPAGARTGRRRTGRRSRRRRCTASRPRRARPRRRPQRPATRTPGSARAHPPARHVRRRVAGSAAAGPCPLCVSRPAARLRVLRRRRTGTRSAPAPARPVAVSSRPRVGPSASC